MDMHSLDARRRTAAPAIGLMLLLATFACGGAETREPGGASAPVDAADTEETPTAPTDATDTMATTPAIGGDTGSDRPDTAREPAGAGKARPAVTSLDEQPIDAVDLHTAYFHWNGETVTVTGYPYVFMPSGRGRWSSRVQLTPGPEPKTPTLLECELPEDQVPEGRLTSDTVLTVRGKVRQAGWGRNFAVRDDEPPRISLDDGCQLVATDGEMPAGGDPWALGSDPIPVAALHEAMFGWQGETVRVVGYYGGTTTSTPGFDPAKTRTSHGLKTGASGEGVVHCDHPGEVQAPASVVEKRDGTLVEGTLGEPSGDVVVLDDCSIVEGS